MTKQPLHDEALKNQLTIEDVKVEVAPKMIDNSMAIDSSHTARRPKGKMKVAMARSKAPVKRIGKIDKATQYLYDLEDSHEPEKTLNVDFDLYQMEDY